MAKQIALKIYVLLLPMLKTVVMAIFMEIFYNIK